MNTSIVFPAGILLLAISLPVPGQELLDGEFSDIELGRELIEPGRFPTIAELRLAVKDRDIRPVLMMKLYGDENNHHLPIWSQDGERLAFQRSKVGARTSKLLLFSPLSLEEPLLLSRAADQYDYMFRWGVNSPAGFAFARIDGAEKSTHIYFSPDGQQTERRTATAGQHVYPTLFERTDGIWRLVYERQGRLIHDAWDKNQRIDEPFELALGTAPRWSRDGYRLLMLRERSRNGRLAAMDVVIRKLAGTANETVLPGPRMGLLRSPVWSPDEQSVAFLAQEPGDNKPWSIWVCDADGTTPGRMLAKDVVVNPDFKSEGPSWEPSGQRIWYFTQTLRQQGYYPLAAASLGEEATAIVNYTNRVTTPSDVAVNPVTEVPEIAFVGHQGLSKDLFVVFLNHY